MLPVILFGVHARRACGALALLLLAGCVFLPAETPLDAPPVAVTEPVPPPPPVEPPSPPPPQAAVPVPEPVVAPPQEVLILFEQGTAGQAEVAAALAQRFAAAERFRVETADLDAAGTRDLLIARRARPRLLAIAVGYAAALAAREELTGPVVFCQVFNYREIAAAGRAFYGVAPLPPLGLQLRSWKSVDPSLQRVALIVSEAQVALGEEARRAGAEVGIEVAYEISTSDRETLYLFKRLGSEVDGLLVVPDNRILSVSVLQEMIDYGLAHGVGALVSNEALLPLGALLSARATPEDVARAVHAVAERIAAGRTAGLPPLSELQEAHLRVNVAAAERLGLPGPFAADWVAREHD